ncbi:DUF1475 domain-containing protein [bacterium]|nr:DUF1475 domain-containing protein [bacterium]
MKRPLGSIAIVGILLVGLLGSFAWAGAQSNLFEGFGRVLDEPWGVVETIDLYLGFAFVSVWIALLERRPGPAIAWIVALMLLGNAITLVYVGIRLWRFGSWRKAILVGANG